MGGSLAALKMRFLMILFFPIVINKSMLRKHHKESAANEDRQSIRRSKIFLIETGDTNEDKRFNQHTDESGEGYLNDYTIPYWLGVPGGDPLQYYPFRTVTKKYIGPGS